MIYRRIRDLREDKDLTQSEIAAQLHIAQRTYSQYETGDRGIPVEVLSQIADIHHTSVDYLLERTNIKSPYKKK